MVTDFNADDDHHHDHDHYNKHGRPLLIFGSWLKERKKIFSTIFRKCFIIIVGLIMFIISNLIYNQLRIERI